MPTLDTSAPKLPCAADELRWQAFCYVTGEMETHQAAQFENRLADDQMAREAVAAALETLQLITAAESLSPVTQMRAPAGWLPSAGWRRNLSWMSLGAAAAWLLAVGVSGSWMGGAGEDWRSAGLTPELAIVWSQTQRNQADFGPLLVPADTPHSQSEASEVDDDLWHVDARHAAPAWMMAAVRSLAQDKLSDELPVSPASPTAPVEMEN